MLSHTSPLSNKNETEQDKSPVRAKTNQLTAKIDNSLSNSQNIDEIIKRNQHASTSVSVTSKNITTANYLNQNNQYITSQPIPSQNAFLTLNNASSPQKTTLDELEKKLLELEKATQDPKSIFSQNPLFTSTETLSLAEQSKHTQKFGSPLQGRSEIPQSGQSYQKENSEKKKMSPGKHKQSENSDASETRQGSNIERRDQRTSNYDLSSQKSQGARSEQLPNQEEGGEGADDTNPHNIQKGVASQNRPAQDLTNELKNNLKPSFGTQNAQQRSQISHSNTEFQEGNRSSTGSAEHQNFHQNFVKSQQYGERSQEEGLEGPQVNQRSGAAHSNKSQAQNSAENAFDASSAQTDQSRRLENKPSQNKAVADSPDLDKRQASFGHNSSHHETQVRTIDLQDLMPTHHGLEDSRSRQDNTHASSQNPVTRDNIDQVNPFSTHQEGAFRHDDQHRYESQYEDSQGPYSRVVDNQWQNQSSSASKGTDLARFKQDVSEFLVSKKKNPTGKNEPEANREPFQKSFENNLSVEQERKMEFSADKNIHFGTNETEERSSSSGTKNPKSSLKKGASKNQKLNNEQNEFELNKESAETNSNLRPSVQSKKNAQYNSSETEAVVQRRNPKETSSEAVERTSSNKQRNMGKIPISSDASQAKTPVKADKVSMSDKKGNSNFPTQNKKAEENQAYSAEKKGALNRNEEEEQDPEGLFSSNNVYNNNNNNNNQRGQNIRFSDARRLESSPDAQSDKVGQRLSKMNEDQAASLYEQRKNDLQKNLQKISKKKGTTKIPVVDKKQPKPIQSSAGVSNVIPASELRSQQQQKVVGAEAGLYSQVKQPTEDRSQTIQTQESAGSRQKAPPSRGKAEGSNQTGSKGRDSKNLWEKGSKTDTKQNRDYQDNDTVNKYGDAIQNARENILQRMENIERALNKDDSSSARSDKRSSYSAEKDKSKIRPRDIRTAEGQPTHEGRAPLGYGAKSRTPISAKTEISTATSPQDQQAILTSNKAQGFSSYASIKSQAKNIQKERLSSKPEMMEAQYEPARAGSSSTTKNTRNIQTNLREEKEKNTYNRFNEPYEGVTTPKGGTNTDSKSKKISFPVTVGDQNRVDVRTPSKKEEYTKLIMSETKKRPTANELANAQRDMSGSKPHSRNLEGTKVSHSEIPSHSKYHEKKMKAQLEREESMLNNNAGQARNLERTNTYSSEVPAHSKYHEKRTKAQVERESQEPTPMNQPQYKGQQQRKDKSLVQEEVDQRSPKRANQNLSPNQKRENIKNMKEVSFSPRVQEYYSKPTGGYNLNPLISEDYSDLSFEERNRLWVIKKNQNLAEKERMKYSQESIDCTFQPVLHQNENMKKLTSNEFYQKNIEWSEKIRAENLMKAEIRLEEQQKPEPPKPKIRSNPTSPIVSLKPHGIFANKDLETIKKNLDFADHLSNKKLKTYLDYDWNDDRLKQEIDDIEELYNYVKGLVKNRLDPNTSSKSYIAERPSTQSNIQRQNASPYAYKQKNPLGRVSMSAEKEVPRMQSLRNIVVHPNRDSHLASERASITRKPELEGTIHQEPGFNALMDKSASTRLLIKDNRYVIIDDNAPDAGNMENQQF